MYINAAEKLPLMKMIEVTSIGISNMTLQQEIHYIHYLL